MQIYLDYSATTPPRREVIRLMQKVFTQDWGNPSSLHGWGQRSALVLEQARQQVAGLIGAGAETIVFTSGGTEADNLAVFGVTQQYAQPRHLVISSVEHSAIEEPVRWLEHQGWQATRLAVNDRGQVNPGDLRRAIRPDTVLVSVIYGQSEVGTLQPVADLGKICREAGVLFHTDAVQAAGRLPIDVEHLSVDLLSLSSHKLYGPQGTGALYVRPGTVLTPVQMGGGQEGGWRSGTQAVAAIAGFGLAAELAQAELETESLRLRQLRDRLFEQLAPVSELLITGDRRQRLPHHLSFCVDASRPPDLNGVSYGLGQLSVKAIAKPLSGKKLVREMNMAGIGISSGSACSSGKTTPSRVLAAMGYSEAQALNGIRITLGKYTTEADVDWTAMVIKQILSRLAPPPVLVPV